MKEEWNGLPAGTFMGHVHLHVADLHQTEKFYNVLGFEVVTNYPNALFMSNGKYHHHIGLNTWHGGGANQPSENSAGLRAFTIVYPNNSELEEVKGKVESLGMSVEAGVEGFIVKDPSGNRIILREE